MIFEVARALNSVVYNLFDLVSLCHKFLFFAPFAVLLYLFFRLTVVQSTLGSFVVYLATGGWRFVRVIYLTVGRDFRALLYLIDVHSVLKKYERTGENVVTLFLNTVRNHPKKVAMVMVDEKQWTFQEVDEFSNQIANYFHDRGYRKGDVVALFMESRPEFVMIWLGLAKIGVVSAFINFNLRRDILVHSITASNAKSMIYDADLMEAVHDIRSILPPNFALYCKCYGDCEVNGLGAVHLDQVLSRTSTFPPPKDHVSGLNEKLFYIYTSGTTGVPKAAIVSHARFFYMSRTVYHFLKIVPADIIYNVLPLYHIAGGVLGVGHCLMNGCTLVIRRKFSASRFWDDCCTYNCTVAQYIGEICRYLLAQPQKPVETEHKVRVVFGNGLRPQIWNEFQRRFKIKQVGEFYGATEGNASMINPDNVPGAIGFQSRILPFVYPVALVKVDLTTGLLIRNKRGLCMRCGPGEPGELVGKIVEGSPLRQFDGYTSEEASKKKMAFNVFRKGDCYFLTGDILEMDDLGYMYFRDRTGDTFRWRGENVSTSEVEAVISNSTKLKDAVVYGVEVPGNEGRAGMAAIVDEQLELDLKQLNCDLQKCLPRYARPIFIRLVDKVDITETFKLKKINYRRDGFDPSVIKDHLFYWDQSSGEYKTLDHKVYDDICWGRIQF